MSSESEIITLDCSSIPVLEDYDLPLHIASIFILVAVSLAGSLFPLLYSKWASTGNRTASQTSKILLRLGIMFGSGTLLATGFIHMLMPAIAALTNPCLPPLFSEEYTAFATLFAMMAMLLMQLLQISLSSYFGRRNQTDNVPSESSNVLLFKHTHNHSHTHHNRPHQEIVGTGTEIEIVPDACDNSNEIPTQKRIAVALLEIGIATHSVIIGMALGLASGAEFQALLIALCFHQFFEGLALGSTIVEAKFQSDWSSMLLASIYGVTTPLGIGIGIAVRNSFVPNSVEALLTVGIFDSISAGILIYTALVEFITPEINDSLEFKMASPGSKALQLFFLYLGIATMAIIGKFA